MKETMKRTVSYEVISENGTYEDKFKKDVDLSKISEENSMMSQESVSSEKSLEEKEKKLIPREVFYEYAEMNPDQYRNAYFTREKMNYDTAKLGSKVRFKPNEAEKQMNASIDKAKAISKKATAYTYETAYIVDQANSSMREKAKNLADSSMREKADSYLEIVESVHFTAKMFSSAYIRKNLSTCLKMVKSFDELKALYKAGYDASMDDLPDGNMLTHSQAKRIDDLEGIMNLFSKRVNEYVKKNHVNIENGKGDDSELTDLEKITDDNYRDWLSLTGDLKAKRKEERKKKSLESVTGEALGDVSEQRLSKASETFDLELDKVEFNYEKMLAAKSSERINSYGMIQSYVNSLREQIGDKALHSDESEGFLSDDKKLQLIKAKAILKIAELEMKFAQLKLDNGEEAMKDPEALMKLAPWLCEEYAKARDNAAKLTKKLDRKNNFLVDERTAPSGIHVLTREEALSNYTDRRSMDKRIDLLRSSDRLKKELGNIDEVSNLISAVESYFDKNVYSSGAKAESDALLRVIRLSKNEKIVTLSQDHHPELKELLDKVSALTTGNLQVPEGAQIIDKSRPGERPKTTGKRNFGHWFAKPLEDFYKFFRKWEKPAADTPLFAHEPTINDLRQGKVSNCWMVAGTTAVINQNPDAIKDCMRDNGDGTVTVRLYKSQDGVPTPMYIKVTKEVPKLVTGGSIHTSGALWMQILEKAAAFVGYKKPTELDENAGYDALWHGKQGNWIFALTGRYEERIINSARGSVLVEGDLFLGEVEGFSKQKSTSMGSDDHHLKSETFQIELFNQLIHARENGKIFTYGSKMSNTPGMTTGHAYTVVSAGEDMDGRFVLLRNPYGNMSAKYNDNGELEQTDSWFTSSMNETCGMFKISYEDFLKNCGELSIIDMNGELKNLSEIKSEPVNMEVIKEENQSDDF